MRRPGVAPFQWAYAALSGRVIVPLAGKAAEGYEAEEEVPAGWFNYHLNLVGQWLGYLAGPSLTTWSLWTFPTADNAYAAPIRGAVDLVTEDSAEARYRYAVVTHDDTGPCVLVSRRGQEWVRRRNLPSGATSPRGVAVGSDWFAWTDDAIYYATRDDASNAFDSALRDDGTDWGTAALPMSPGSVRAVAASDGAPVVASSSTKILASNNLGLVFVGVTVSGRQEGRDLVVSGFSWLDLSSDAGNGYLLRCVGDPSVAGNWTHVQTLTGVGAATSWRLAVGAVNGPDTTVVAYKTGVSDPRLHISTDDGLTWTQVSAIEPPQNVTALVYRDGVWVATQTTAPYAQTSSDLERWLPLPVPVGEDGSSRYDVLFGNGSWLLVGDAGVLQGAPAVDPSPEGYTPNTSASALADAGALRGYRLSTTAPTDGQALLYVSSTGRWTPTTLPAAPTLPWSSAGAPATVQTTDATVTTLATIPTTTDKGLTLQVLVSATKGDRSAIVSWLYLVSVVNVGGTPSVMDALQLGCTDPAASHVDGTAPVAFDVSSTTIRVRVKGVAATTVDWSAARVSLLGS